MKERQLKWYLKKMAKEKGITEEEYYNNYYKKNVIENKTVDKVEYMREYMQDYRNNEHYKEYQRQYHRNRKSNKSGNYIYFIKEDNGLNDMLYIGSCSVIEDRISIHKSVGKIKKALNEGINYSDIKVFYLELPSNWSKSDRELLEHCYIDAFRGKYNKRVKDYNKARTLELLKEVDYADLREYKI